MRQIVILVGRLGADPEVRQTQGGTVVATMRLATDERTKQGGEWVDHTEWHRVVAFGRTAEVVRDYCAKGKPLYIEGRIRTRKWKDSEGNDRYSTEIIADTLKMLGGGQGGGRSGAPATGSAPDEDIPW